MTNPVTPSAAAHEPATRRYSSRVKQILLGITCVLSLLAIGFAANGIVRAVTADSNAKRIIVVNEATDFLLQAAGAWALERGLTAGAMQDRAAAPADVVNQIKQRREAGDAALASALKIIETVGDFANKDKLVSDAKGAHATLSGLRPGADAGLGQPLDKRDPAVAQRIGPALNELIQITARLRRATGRVAADLEGLVGTLANLKHGAWVAAEYAGRERAAIAGSIRATAQLAAAQFRTLSDLRGRLETGWSDVRALAGGASTPAAIKAAVADAERAFFADFERTRESVYQAAAAGQPLPVTAEQWFSAATTGIAALLKVGEVAGVETKTYASANASAAGEATMAMGVLMALTVALAGFAFWATTSRVTRPLAAMTASMGKLAAGDKTIEVPGLQRTDEIGAMAAAVQVFKQNMIENERLQAEQREAERRAAEQEKQREEEQRQAEARAAEERRKAMLELADSFEQTVGGVIQTVSVSAQQMEASAQSLSATAEETSRQSTSVAAAAEQATANVQTVATASEELSASIAEIARQVAESARIANGAVSEAQETNERVKGLSVAANKIGDVVALITDIASQTNLLALNATIEAARAGEAGKGFAVVASEVKTLANQTAKATDEIAGQIASIQGATNEAVSAIESISKTIVEINDIASSIASAVEQQGAATKDIASNVQQAAQGTQDVSSNIAGVMSAAEQTGAAATQVLGAARSVSTESASLGEAVNKFLERVRAA